VLASDSALHYGPNQILICVLVSDSAPHYGPIQWTQP